MNYITTLQANQLIEQYKAKLAERSDLNNAERSQRMHGFLHCMCQFGAIDGYQIDDIYTNYQKELSRG